MTTIHNSADRDMSGTAVEFERKRIEPLKAWRAIKALIADKEDTGQVFKIIDALAGSADQRAFEKFIRTETGKRISAEKRDLIGLLNNRDYLKSLPEGTLGRTYYEFMAEENLTADGLVAASMEAPRRRDRPEEAMHFGDRMRDSHDLWHVTAGYGRDGLGELSLLSFYYAQTRNRGIGFIVLMGAQLGMRAARGAGVWAAVREGYRRGKKAKWMPAADWEALIEKPLGEVRASLDLSEPVIYDQVGPIVAEIEKKFVDQMKMAA